MFPEKPFLPSPLINVPSSEVIGAAYQGDPDLQVVGPYQDNEASVEALTICPLMYLPLKFVPMVMSDETLFPQECWHRLASQLGLTQESIVDHKPLVDWLRAACTIGTSRHPANISDTTLPVSTGASWA
jgi:hypothetical protein